MKSSDYPVASVPAVSCQLPPPPAPKIEQCEHGLPCDCLLFSASGRAPFSTLRKSLFLPPSCVHLGLRALNVLVQAVPERVGQVRGVISSTGIGVARE